MIRKAGFVAFLLGIWLLLWGEVSVANVVSGLLVAALLLVVFPRTPSTATTGFVVRPLPTLRFVLFFGREMVESVLLLSREVLSRRSRIHTGVIAVPVHGCPGSLLAAIANLLALTPGTMTVRIETDPPTLYVHVLIFRDIERVRVKIEQLNRLVVLAFAGPDDCARFLEASR
jgi:multicomponent Na+:H+ antiporter subunit E